MWLQVGIGEREVEAQNAQLQIVDGRNFSKTLLLS